MPAEFGLSSLKGPGSFSLLGFLVDDDNDPAPEKRLRTSLGLLAIPLRPSLPTMAPSYLTPLKAGMMFSWIKEKLVAHVISNLLCQDCLVKIPRLVRI